MKARKERFRVKRCKICLAENQPWTKEHAYPQWLRAEIMAWYRRLPPGAVKPGWDQTRATLLHPVCEGCQRRLNAVFETPAKPLLLAMLDDSVMMLTPSQQVVIAAWFVKTSAVLALCPGRVPAVTPEGLERLRTKLVRMLDTGTPPENTTARIAYVTRTISHTISQSLAPFVPPPWPDKSLYNGVGIISIPGLVCEIMDAGGPLIPFIDATKNDRRFLRIWPPQLASVWWPPPLRLSLMDVRLLREQWEHRPETVHGNFATVTATLPPD